MIAEIQLVSFSYRGDDATEITDFYNPLREGICFSIFFGLISVEEIDLFFRLEWKA